MNQLYLLRHGIALPHGTPGMEDDDRPLTKLGRTRLVEVARGLKRLGVEVDLIASSPLPRALATSEIVAEVFGAVDLIETFDELRAGREAGAIRDWLGGRPEARLMVVGHNPAISALLALLTTGEGRIFCDLRKGGFAALTGLSPGSYQVDWIARPKLFRR